jgi:hypothetical protein
MTDIKAGIVKHLNDEFNIDPNVTALLFDKGVLSFCACRDLLIREEYRRKAEPKEKRRLKNKIADKYCISVELVEKITRNNL